MTDALPDGQPDVRLRERLTPRTARYVMVGAEPANARRIWFVLHGYGMLASRFVRAFVGVVPADTCIVAPEALSRFYLEMPRPDGGHLQRVGATWLTRESRDTEIADAHAWLNRVRDEIMAEAMAAQGTAPVTAVLGFSQGVATAMRWIAGGTVSPTQFVAWAGGLAQDVDASAFQTAMGNNETLLILGTDDEFATDVSREKALRAMAALGVRYRTASFTGGHVLDRTMLSRVLHDLPLSSA